MSKRIRALLISSRVIALGAAVLMLLAASLACNLPVGEAPEADQPEMIVETSIAQTIAAAAQDSAGEDTEPDDTPEEASSTPGLSATPEPTATETIIPTSTATAAPEFAKVYVSENTNCRTGPGAVYDWLTVLLSGEEAEVFAKDPDHNFWYIRQPESPENFCWLWGRYATPEGETENLPVYTPPPTPTASFAFDVSYQKLLGPCGGDYALMYRIDNVGSFTLESWRTTAIDHTGGAGPQEWIEDSFYEYSGCSSVNHQVDLTPGESYYLYTRFDKDPKGHDITSKIKICTKDGLGGECMTKNFRHTP